MEKRHTLVTILAITINFFFFAPAFATVIEYSSQFYANSSELDCKSSTCGESFYDGPASSWETGWVGWNDTVDVPLFDPSLGKLTKATFWIDATYSWSATTQVDEVRSPGSIVLQSDTSLSVINWGTTTPIPIIDPIDPLPESYFTVIGSGSSTFIVDPGTYLLGSAETPFGAGSVFTDEAKLNDISNMGSVVEYLIIDGSGGNPIWDITGDMSGRINFDYVIDGSFNARYEYSKVPEPSSLTLMGISLLGFGFLRLRKQA